MSDLTPPIAEASFIRTRWSNDWHSVRRTYHGADIIFSECGMVISKSDIVETTNETPILQHRCRVCVTAISRRMITIHD